MHLNWGARNQKGKLTSKLAHKTIKKSPPLITRKLALAGGNLVSSALGRIEGLVRVDCKNQERFQAKIGSRQRDPVSSKVISIIPKKLTEKMEI